MRKGSNSPRSNRISQSSDRGTNNLNKLLSSQRETIENTSNSLVSAKATKLVEESVTEENGLPEHSSRRAPSNSIDLMTYDEDDYKSMWADISQNTTGKEGTKNDEEMTEYSGIFHQT